MACSSEVALSATLRSHTSWSKSSTQLMKWSLKRKLCFSTTPTMYAQLLSAGSNLGLLKGSPDHLNGLVLSGYLRHCFRPAAAICLPGGETGYETPDANRQLGVVRLGRAGGGRTDGCGYGPRAVDLRHSSRSAGRSNDCQAT